VVRKQIKITRAKLNSLLNYVNKGQNRGQIRDNLLFSWKSWFKLENCVGLVGFKSEKVGSVRY